MQNQDSQLKPYFRGRKCFFRGSELQKPLVCPHPFHVCLLAAAGEQKMSLLRISLPTLPPLVGFYHQSGLAEIGQWLQEVLGEKRADGEQSHQSCLF